MIYVLATGLILSLFTQAGYAVRITQCDTTVPAGQTGELENDLYCEDAAHAVRLLDDATLNLNGYSITGTFLPWPHDERQAGSVIECDGDCAIGGPGEIYGTNAPAVTVGWNSDLRTVRRAHLTISNVNIHDCADGVARVPREECKPASLRRT